jgi:hypothetical protein
VSILYLRNESNDKLHQLLLRCDAASKENSRTRVSIENICAWSSPDMNMSGTVEPRFE